jgi:hypothetical protein
LANTFCVRTPVRAEVDPDSTAIQQLLESFATSALGVELGARIDDAPLPTSLQYIRIDAHGLFGRCSWQTSSGPLTLLGWHDKVQSELVAAHVLLFELWIGTEKHQYGWWHCYPKFPRDWIKGRGTVNRW